MTEVTIDDIKQDAASEDNEMLLRRFVGMVGYDYVTDHQKHTANFHPEFSDDTKVFWEEIERRLNAPTVLDFDRDAYKKQIHAVVNKQEWYIKHGQAHMLSYHAGVKSGLQTALEIANKNTMGKGEKREC